VIAKTAPVTPEAKLWRLNDVPALEYVAKSSLWLEGNEVQDF
jgi:hypothetical protein